jgi:hypothetical protein
VFVPSQLDAVEAGTLTGLRPLGAKQFRTVLVPPRGCGRQQEHSAPASLIIGVMESSSVFVSPVVCSELSLRTMDREIQLGSIARTGTAEWSRTVDVCARRIYVVRQAG